MSKCEKHLKESKGSFDSLSKRNQEVVMEIVANFHIRNGKEHDDGSKGDITITPGEMNDIIAYSLLKKFVAKMNCPECRGRGRTIRTAPTNTGNKEMIRIEVDCSCLKKK
ncbi:hypothetical protein HN682_00970 [Candidatus Peregrinibacteria bacterium]|jgi:hypothetical protein|nr:hypothetical protein [Candidatus Peregrinibacteria bacterium]